MEATILITSIISLTIIILTWLLRDRFGPTEAKRLLDFMQANTHAADLFLAAARQAVTEVENTLKRYKDLTDAELKDEAVRIMTEVLNTWGVYVDSKMLSGMLAMVETAYQQLKTDKETHENWLMGEPIVPQ